MAEVNSTPPGVTGQPDPTVTAPHPGYGYGYGYGYGLPYDSGRRWEEGLDAGTLIRVVWQKKLTFVLTTSFVLLSVFFYLRLAVPIYEARSSIELSVRRPRIMSQQEAVINNDVGSISTAEILNTQLLKLQGLSFRKTALSALCAEQPNILNALRAVHPNILGGDDKDALKFLERNVKIALIRRSSLIMFTVSSSNAVLAATIANTYANLAVSSAFSLNKDASDTAVEWLQAQAVAQRKLLQKAEEALLAFNRQNIIETHESMRKTAEGAMLTYNEELAKTVAAREVALAKFTEKHPEVRTLDTVIASTRKRFDEEVERVKQLDLKISEAKAKLNSLQRDADACELNYKGILHRMEEARLSADEKTTSVKLVETADVPAKPVKPRKLVIILLALTVAPFCGTVMSLLAYRMENRVWNPNEAASEAGLRLLGAVTHARVRDRRKLAMASRMTKLEAVTESFAAIRAVVESDKSWKTLLITSSTAEEGKTISCCNLAISFAESGTRTLLIDLDMRRPRLRQIFGVSVSSQNLLHTQILADEPDQDFASLPVQTDIPNLDLLATLPAAVRPAEVLGSPRIHQFIEWAEGNYDRVIIDSPPMSVGSDSMFLSSVVDYVILVCRFNRSKKSMLQFSVRRLQDCGAKIMGLIVNDVRSSSFGHYHSGYYYGTYGGERRWKNPPVHA